MTLPGVKSIAEAAVDAELAITEPLPEAVVGAEQWTFLGRGWTYGLALEAGLKMREAAGAWTESYPAMEYRHGPISITGPGRVTWVFGAAPGGPVARRVPRGRHAGGPSARRTPWPT